MTLVAPTCTLPKLNVVGVAESAPAAVPAPERATVNGEPGALLVMSSVPLALPLDCGVKTTLNVLLAPAASVTGSVRPFMLKAAPETVAWLMVRLEPPELVSVSCNVLLLPVCTEPKLRDGLPAASVPGVAPVPERATVNGDPEASLAMLNVPLAAPLAVGLNTTLKVVVAPAFKVNGALTPVML